MEHYRETLNSAGIVFISTHGTNEDLQSGVNAVLYETPADSADINAKRLRACLISGQQKRNEGKNSHLYRSMQLTFAIRPKSNTPAKIRRANA